MVNYTANISVNNCITPQTYWCVCVCVYNYQQFQWLFQKVRNIALFLVSLNSMQRNFSVGIFLQITNKMLQKTSMTRLTENLRSTQNTQSRQFRNINESADRNGFVILFSLLFLFKMKLPTCALFLFNLQWSKSFLHMIQLKIFFFRSWIME